METAHDHTYDPRFHGTYPWGKRHKRLRYLHFRTCSRGLSPPTQSFLGLLSSICRRERLNETRRRYRWRAAAGLSRGFKPQTNKVRTVTVPILTTTIGLNGFAEATKLATRQGCELQFGWIVLSFSNIGARYSKAIR